MGYTTTFQGQFNLDKPLSEPDKKYLIAFNESRRMKRDESIVSTLKDPIRKNVSLPVGVDGGYFVGGMGFMGQGEDKSVVEYNNPPTGQPALWCKWTPNEDGTAILWDGAEKFYGYVEWIEYLIKHFLAPWGYTLNGSVTWQGEEHGDTGSILITNNEVKIVHAK